MKYLFLTASILLSFSAAASEITLQSGRNSKVKVKVEGCEQGYFGDLKTTGDYLYATCEPISCEASAYGKTFGPTKWKVYIQGYEYVEIAKDLTQDEARDLIEEKKKEGVCAAGMVLHHTSR